MPPEQCRLRYAVHGVLNLVRPRKRQQHLAIAQVELEAACWGKYTFSCAFEPPTILQFIEDVERMIVNHVQEGEAGL